MANSPFIIELNDQNFADIVIKGSSKQPVLVDFWADWCPPCKAMMPTLEKLAIEYDGAFILAKLDTEKHKAISQQFGIRSLPTLKLFKNKKVADEFMGARPESAIKAFLSQHLTVDT